MSEQPQPPLTPTQRAGRAEARHEILREALEILAHDLSNPLQSLIVMTEMALDDAPPDSEDYERNQQSLEAAERMKTLVHGLAGLTRPISGSRSATAVMQRMNAMLSRRWERHRIAPSIALAEIERLPTPPGFDSAILNLCLAVVTAAREASHPRYELSFRGLRSEGPLPCTVEITLAGHNAGGSGVPVELDRVHLQRTRQLLDGDPQVALREDEEAVLLDFAPDEASPA